MRPRTFPLTLALPALLAASCFAQNSPILGENTVKVSDHVWAIMGFPNIGIVVGKTATLVVDTGLGPQNGATVAKAALKLAPHNRLYLTTRLVPMSMRAITTEKLPSSKPGTLTSWRY